MPPLFTSTSLTALVKQVMTMAKHAKQPAAVKVTSASRARASRAINTLQRTRQAVHNAVHQTFPALSTPAHQLQYATIPIRAGRRTFTSVTNAASSNRRLGSVRQALHSSGARPRWTHGPSISTNVGLGSARTFASAPAGSVQAKVPMAMRAFVFLLDDNDRAGQKPLPRPSRYTPYSSLARSRHQRRQRRPTCSSIDSSFIREIQHYFPLPVRASVEVEISLPPTPETLVTEGKTTILALPLSPSLEALLSPTAQLPYADTSIGIHILARLTQGLFPIHNAFSLHSSTRIIPLLTKLDNLGVLDFHPASPRTEAEVVEDGEGRPDILRLVFHDRSVEDIKALLGESLRKAEEGEWWALYEEDQRMKLSSGERQAIMEEWGDRPPRPTIQSSQRDNLEEGLVFPTLDMSLAIQSGEVIFDAVTDPGDSPSFTPASWDMSGVSTPSSLGSPYAATPSDCNSLTASLLSRLAESDVSYSSASDDGVWSVYPSDSDSDVESAFAASAEWGDVSAQFLADEAVVETVLQRDQGSVYSNWTGSGEGFGFLAEPW
ncbi:hypothetical protein IAU60_001003 [Kwoniella sp. DSM 27419]